MTPRILSLALLITMTLLALAIPVSAEDVDSEFESYDDLRTAVLKLWRAEQPEEAIRLFRTGLHLFPDSTFKITSSLINMNLASGRAEDCFEIFELGHEKDLYYPIYTESGPFNSFLDNPRFQAILQRNRALIAEAEKDARMQLRVVAPEGKGGNSSYPLLIVLHGWSGSIGSVERSWKPESIGAGLIVAYLQSSQIVGMGMFGWDDLERSRRDVREAYEELLSDYPVDRSKVVVAGFSQGGRTAIDAAVNNVIPVAGFVAHCPGGGLTESISIDDVRSAAGRGLRGMILTGNIDHSRDEQEELVGLLERGSLVHRYVTIPELGHWYPEDFPARLDAAIAYSLSLEVADES